MVSIVIPAYNEAARLPAGLESVARYLLESKLDAEVIVVDDGSTDGTAQVARQRGAELGLERFEILVQDPNQGKGAAVRRGVLAAKGERIVMTDTDMSTPIEEMPKLLAALDGGYQVAIGSRYVDRSLLEERQPFYREFSSMLYNRAVQATMLPGVRDTQCGFKAFDAAAAREIFDPLIIQGFAFDVEVLYRARRRGMRIKEVAVRWKDAPGSTVKPIRHAITSTLSLVKIRLQTR
jgi:dolichyl-phosphate beta-glucosyltransferase